MKSLFEKFQTFTTCCDVIIPNLREMDQIKEQWNYLSEQQNYLSDRHQNWYLEHFEGAKSKNKETFSVFSTFHHLL